jgi:hypothetical protein
MLPRGAGKGSELGLWRDDARVVPLQVRKTFGAAADVGARVTVATLEELAS